MGIGAIEGVGAQHVAHGSPLPSTEVRGAADQSQAAENSGAKTSASATSRVGTHVHVKA